MISEDMSQNGLKMDRKSPTTMIETTIAPETLIKGNKKSQWSWLLQPHGTVGVAIKTIILPTRAVHCVILLNKQIASAVSKYNKDLLRHLQTRPRKASRHKLLQLKLIQKSVSNAKETSSSKTTKSANSASQTNLRYSKTKLHIWE